MIGLVLVTHGRLAEELRSAMEHVVGPQRNVATICIGPDDDIERRRQDIHDCIEEVDAGDGVVLLTDMFGGTPSNLAISMMSRPGTEVIAGVNLPMLVKLAQTRGRKNLPECVDGAEAAGRKYIAAASHVLSHAKSMNTCTMDPRAHAALSHAALDPRGHGAPGGPAVVNNPAKSPVSGPVLAAGLKAAALGAPASQPLRKAQI